MCRPYGHMLRVGGQVDVKSWVDACHRGEKPSSATLWDILEIVPGTTPTDDLDARLARDHDTTG